MDITPLSKPKLLEKCRELGITKCKSKNKAELIDLINSKHQPKNKKNQIEFIIEEDDKELLDNQNINLDTLIDNHHVDENIIRPLKNSNGTPFEFSTDNSTDNLEQAPHMGAVSNLRWYNNNVSYFNIDILNFTTSTKFDLIYLDPPYETNRIFTVNSIDDETGFDDTWVDDKYEEWLELLIKHLYPMLSVNGTLVFHISSENSFIAENVLRKYFKKIQKIYWKRCHGKNTVKNKLGEMIDILFACSNTTTSIFNMLYTPIDENSVWAFKNKDERGEYSLGALKHDRTRSGYMYTIEKEGIIYENKYGWKQKKEVVEELIKENRIHFVPKQKNMYVKIYKHEHKGVPLSNLWTDIHSITRTSKDPRIYPTQKPQKLLERIIKIYSNENSYILDPVCGSGTTGFVGDKMKRKCVLCDINKDTFEIIKKRFDDKIYNI
jgi:DNA modification methylase